MQIPQFLNCLNNACFQPQIHTNKFNIHWNQPIWQLSVEPTDQKSVSMHKKPRGTEYFHNKMRTYGKKCPSTQGGGWGHKDMSRAKKRKKKNGQIIK
jgi:hypothetical protein